MSGPLASSLAQLLEQLDEFIVGEAAWPSPDTGFAAHVFARLGRDPPAAVRAALSAAVVSPNPMSELRMAEAPVLAAEGFALAIDADEARRRRWADSAVRLTQRDPFPPDRASFFYRPVELLGVALGARACADEQSDISAWLRQTIETGRAKLADGVWSQTMAALAQGALETGMTQVRLGTGADVAEIALMHWVTETDPAAADALGVAAPGELERELLLRTALAPLHVGDVARATLISAGIVTATERTLASAHEARWQLDRSKRDTIALLQTLCRRFSRFAREVGQRHGDRPGFQINDEYDVQDALRALLRLHFDDVRPEENVPSHGGARTRLDFLLKRERTVIETKMTRPGLGQRKLVEELTNDKAHYRRHPDCDALVCFIYDPGGRVDNPTALETDLAGTEAGLTTTVIVATGVSDDTARQ